MQGEEETRQRREASAWDTTRYIRSETRERGLRGSWNTCDGIVSLAQHALESMTVESRPTKTAETCCASVTQWSCSCCSCSCSGCGAQSRRFRSPVAHFRGTFRGKQLERAMARHQPVVTGSQGERIMRFRISKRASFLSGTLTSSADSDASWWDEQLSLVDRRVCRACEDPLGSTAHAVVASTTHWPERRRSHTARRSGFCEHTGAPPQDCAS